MENTNSFIVANTMPMSLDEIHQKHIIPVFTKDNSPLISQSEIIESTQETLFKQGYNTTPAEVRVSHPVMGRIPEARFKNAKELLPNEITLYYERMMFLFKVPGIKSMVNGQELTLVVGGIKSYSWDNLGRDQKAHQTFKFFVGFQVFVCSNLCVSSDGSVKSLKTNSINMIQFQVEDMMKSYKPESHLKWLTELNDYSLSETQFAKFIGRCSMQPYTDDAPTFSLTNTQINSVVKGYYTDPYFKGDKEIPLWNLYNLITESNKGSYIDGFLDRNIAGEGIIEDLRHSLHTGSPSYYLN